MPDRISPEKRSQNMSAIRNKDTSGEVFVKQLLFSKGYRFRKNVNRIFGKPDVYLAKYKTVIFVNGCFWHRHQGCKYAYTPKTRVDFWQKKFTTNIERDRVVKESILNSGLKMLVIWECTVNRMVKNDATKKEYLGIIESFLNSSENYKEL